MIITVTFQNKVDDDLIYLYPSGIFWHLQVCGNNCITYFNIFFYVPSFLDFVCNHSMPRDGIFKLSKTSGIYPFSDPTTNIGYIK
jgi:hypothetical protein